MIGSYNCCTIVTGDARELAKPIPDESVDLVFTDPPYSLAEISLYGWLAAESQRIMKPKGFCLALCGGLYLNQIMRMMDEHLDFFWKYEVYLSGWAAGCVWPYGNTDVHIITRTKPLLAYCKGKGLPRCSTVGMVRGSGKDKRFHAWQQDEVTARYYIDCFAGRGEIVWEPLCGSGTTVAMAHQLGMHYLAFEIDPDVAERARERVRNTQPPLFVLQPEQMEMSIDSPNDSPL